MDWQKLCAGTLYKQLHMSLGFTLPKSRDDYVDVNLDDIYKLTKVP
jgi:hypothetical protein